MNFELFQILFAGRSATFISAEKGSILMLHLIFYFHPHVGNTGLVTVTPIYSDRITSVVLFSSDIRMLFHCVGALQAGRSHYIFHSCSPSVIIIPVILHIYLPTSSVYPEIHPYLFPRGMIQFDFLT